MFHIPFRAALCGVAGFSLLVSLASATTIVSRGGDSGTSEPLGYYPSLAPDYTPAVFAVSWTQANAYQNVTFAATMFDSDYIPSGDPAYLGGYVNYELVNAIGPGTSYAANGIAQGRTFIGDTIESETLFTLPYLAAGKYYLVLDGSGSLSLMYNSFGSPAPPPITGDGVTFNGDFWSLADSRDTAYTPGSSFSPANLPGEFSVTAAGVATPEPAAWALVLIGLGIFTSANLVSSCGEIQARLSRTTGLLRHPGWAAHLRRHCGSA